MTLLDGKALAAKIKQQVRAEAETLPRRPGLAVIQVGENAASRTYVRGKRKDCEICGFYSEDFQLPASASPHDVLDLLEELNAHKNMDGVLLQLPLPEGWDETHLLSMISPEKDVDCFHARNMGNLLLNRPVLPPCTPAGILALLDEYQIGLAGRHAVVVGRSNLVGKPLTLMLLARDATVTVCHSKTSNLAEICRQADILVSAAGKRGLITEEMVKPGAAVIDVSINRDENGKLYGDVDFAAVARRAAFLTPVPGGVGPMTRAMLMRNTLLASRRRQGLL